MSAPPTPSAERGRIMAIADPDGVINEFIGASVN